MREKITLVQAREVAEKLKKKYKFGKSTCPAWFGGICTPMQQDGNYAVAICIPSWPSISQDEQNVFFELFEGVHVILRVVTPSKPYNFGKKNDTAQNEERKK